MLVVFDETHLALELRVEVVLALAESVTLLFHGGTVSLLSVAETMIYNVVLSQGVVESTLAVGWVVHEAETSGVV